MFIFYFYFSVHIIYAGKARNPSYIRCLYSVNAICRAFLHFHTYGVATMNRLFKMIGLFCKRGLSKRLYSAQETYDFKDPTNRSHPISYMQARRQNHRHIHILFSTKSSAYSYCIFDKIIGIFIFYFHFHFAVHIIYICGQSNNKKNHHIFAFFILYTYSIFRANLHFVYLSYISCMHARRQNHRYMHMGSHSYGISFILTYSRLHLECHFFIHMGSHSYGITFIWDLIHIDVQPIAFGVPFLRSQISIDDLVLYVSFATFR